MMTLVRRMLASKPEVYTVPPDATVFEALRIMAVKNIGAVLVVSDDELVGILSERDYARKMILHGKHSKETYVREIMTDEVVSVAPTWTCGECMALMTERRIRHLPVLEDSRLVGIISIGDVVRAIVQEQQFTINSLESYIMSGG